MNDNKQPKKIPMAPVESSQIAQLGFDAATKTMAVQFKNYKGEPAGHYHYSNVDQATFDALTAAESIGSHFNSAIKRLPEKYPYTRIDKPAKK